MMYRTSALVAIICLALPRPLAALLAFTYLCSFRSARAMTFGSFSLLCVLCPWVFFGVVGLWLAWLLWSFALASAQPVATVQTPALALAQPIATIQTPDVPLRLRGGAFPDEEDEEDDEDDDDLEESFLIFANDDGDAPVAHTSDGFAVPALPVARCFQRRAATSAVPPSGAVSVAPAARGSSSPVVSSPAGGLPVLSRPIARPRSRRVPASVARSVAPVVPPSSGVAKSAPPAEGSSSSVVSLPLRGSSSVAPVDSSSGGVANVAPPTKVDSSSGGVTVVAPPTEGSSSSMVSLPLRGSFSVAPVDSSSGGVAVVTPPTEGSSSSAVSLPSGSSSSVAPVDSSSGGVAVVAPPTEGSSSSAVSLPLGGSSSLAPVVSSSGGVAPALSWPSGGRPLPWCPLLLGTRRPRCLWRGLPPCRLQRRAATFVARCPSRPCRFGSLRPRWPRRAVGVVEGVEGVAPSVVVLPRFPVVLKHVTVAQRGFGFVVKHATVAQRGFGSAFWCCWSGWCSVGVVSCGFLCPVCCPVFLAFGKVLQLFGSSFSAMSLPSGSSSSVAPVVSSSGGVAVVAPPTEGSSSSVVSLPLGGSSSPASVVSSSAGVAVCAPASPNAGNTGDEENDDDDAVVPGVDGGAGARLDPAGGVLAPVAVSVAPAAFEVLSAAAARSVWSVVDPFDEDVVMAFGEPDWMDVDDEGEGGRVCGDLQEVWDPMDIQEDVAWPLRRGGRRRMTALRKRGCRRRLMALPLGVPARKFVGPYIVPWYKGSSSGWCRRRNAQTGALEEYWRGFLISYECLLQRNMTMNSDRNSF
ncbi:hypothetical protein K501DRAFT_272661 [Backusella circina FSU 941]|nr:hypothetical protein K501DRAFT_272661 [Backusella circina FSU 941]